MNNVSIGSYSRVLNNTQLTEYVKVGKHVFLGPDISTVASDSFGRRKGKYRPDPIIFDDACRVGGNATILHNISIGKDALVAAGSVVFENVPDRVAVMGNPARVYRKIQDDEIFKTNKNES